MSHRGPGILQQCTNGAHTLCTRVCQCRSVPASPVPRNKTKSDDDITALYSLSHTKGVSGKNIGANLRSKELIEAGAVNYSPEDQRVQTLRRLLSAQF